MRVCQRLSKGLRTVMPHRVFGASVSIDFRASMLEQHQSRSSSSSNIAKPLCRTATHISPPPNHPTEQSLRQSDTEAQHHTHTPGRVTHGTERTAPGLGGKNNMFSFHIVYTHAQTRAGRSNIINIYVDLEACVCV